MSVLDYTNNDTLTYTGFIVKTPNSISCEVRYYEDDGEFVAIYRGSLVSYELLKHFKPKYRIELGAKITERIYNLRNMNVIKDNAKIPQWVKLMHEAFTAEEPATTGFTTPVRKHNRSLLSPPPLIRYTGIKRGRYDIPAAQPDIFSDSDSDAI